MINNIDENVIAIELYLRRIDTIIKRKGREILRDFSITIPQFLALQWLINEGSLTIGDLSQKMSLACSTITDLVDRMEKNELVTRVKDNKDKRVVRVEVLQKGHDILSKVMEKRHTYLEGKLKSFIEEDKKYFNDSLKTLYEAMKKENE